MCVCVFILLADRMESESLGMTFLRLSAKSSAMTPILLLPNNPKSRNGNIMQEPMRSYRLLLLVLTNATEAFEPI